MKRVEKKLSIHKETLRQLTPREELRVRGGAVGDVDANGQVAVITSCVPFVCNSILPIFCIPPPSLGERCVIV